MKKSLVLLFFALFALLSLTANAQQSSCNVNGLNGVVATVTPLVKGVSTGTGPAVQVTVRINKDAPEETGVAVEIYDNDNNLVASDMVYISKGYKSQEKYIHGAYIEKGKMYKARLANASCSVPGIQLP